MIQIFLSILLTLFASVSFGQHDHAETEKTHEHEEISESVGPDKAVLEIKNEGRALKLSELAEKKIGLKLATISMRKGVFLIPKSALLEFQAQTAVYRMIADGFLEMAPVTVLKRESDQITVKGTLSQTDKIVVSGVPHLRAAQLEASGQGGEGHAH